MTSSSSLDAGTSLAASSSTIVSGSDSSSRSRAERLTARSRSSPASSHRCSWPSASSRTKRVSGARQPGALRERHELVRGEQAAVGMLPAHERLDADDPVLREHGLRLVVRGTALRWAMPRRSSADERELARAVLVAVGGVELAARVVVLGQVHRDVRTLEQRVDVVAVLGIEGDADARLEVEPDALELERAPQLGADLLGDPERVVLVRHRRQQQAELVAAEARDRVALAERRAKPAADLLQQQVAVRMPERVVDLLEPVEIEQHERDAHVCSLRREDRAARPARGTGSGSGGRSARRGARGTRSRSPGGAASSRRRRRCGRARGTAAPGRRRAAVQAQRVVRDRGGDRQVRQVELERAGGRRPTR